MREYDVSAPAPFKETPVSRDIRTPLLWVVAMVFAATGCTSSESGPDAADPGESASPGESADPPAYCETREEGPDLEFWRLIERACAQPGDIDLDQATVLRAELAELPIEQVANFHRTLVRLNKALATPTMTEIADDVCLPDVGLGDDLGTDYRTWIIAHGQVAYEAVLERPETLRDFPDATQGCGQGEIFGYTALVLYDEQAGSEAEDLPALEPTPGD